MLIKDNYDDSSNEIIVIAIALVKCVSKMRSIVQKKKERENKREKEVR